ncbi:iron uptake transporter permease EfeU [Nakamurella endophytica]|uniref:High-affinity iron transporter n=1 Tax=Nakamurella endophytica TaxID=1748367 RepID=A0A917WMG7_9ACTN|nr:iron uptake transporter permease EfeU [Nakamurella endophytica]GGM15091.1 hypothetical protein GCM10011594_38880 [Nakamurella endophytica]
MLATLVIGLREGLEAALIVGIIAAFLRRSGRPDALRRMWLGVGIAVAVCVAVGVVLQLVDSALPQRQQEMLECVVAAIAVVMVSYMVLWMRAHSRDLKSDLQAAAGGALAGGGAAALVVMAFLAVFREGFETAVFLLAAFHSTTSPVQASIGAVLGVAVALVLGYLIYRGGVRLNLSRFFRITGVVLVLVAAGLVMSTLRAAYEAGWITVGQQTAVRLDVLARPGSVQESLLTGMLGIRATVPVIELVAWALYLVPMLAVVLWPPRRTPSARTRAALLAGTAAVAAVVAVVLVAVRPAASATGPASVAALGAVRSGSDPAGGQDLSGATLTATGTVDVAPGDGSATLDLRLSDGSVVQGSSELRLAGQESVAGRTALRYDGAAVSAPAAASAGLPATLTREQVAALGGGRLPIGTGDVPRTATFAVDYRDSWIPQVSVDQATGTVLGVALTGTRTVRFAVDGRSLSGGSIRSVSLAPDAATLQARTAAAVDAESAADRRQVLGTVVPALLAVFAAVLLAFAAGAWTRRRPAPVPRPAAATPPLATAAPPGTGR